ncbi:MAG: CHASE domain-containing protein [Gammaproteobacteria bacterium]|nr:CHASE domain-containing protein [Gammaproteobacteria bacterium]
MLDRVAILNRLQTVLWHRATPYLVLAIGLGMSVLAWRLEQGNLQADNQVQFDNAAQTMQVWVERRMGRFFDALVATRGLFVSSEHVTREEFSTFVASLKLKERYPGLAAIQYAPRVTPATLDAFQARLKAEGLEDYRVWDIGDGQHGVLREKAEYFPIEYGEPLEPLALGLDVGSAVMNRRAMARARDGGGPALGGRIAKLAGGPANQPGFLAFVPIYYKAMPADSVEQRRAALQGYVIGVFHAADLLANIYDTQQHPLIDFEVFDGAHMSIDTLLYDDDNTPHFLNTPVHPHFEARRVVSIGGHPWTLYFVSLPGFGAGPQAYLPLWVLGSGMLVSTLLFGIALLQVRARARAEHIAADLRQSRARLAQAQRIGRMGHWEWDMARDEVTASEEACRIFGRCAQQPRETLNAFLATVHPDDRELLQKAIEVSLEFGAVLRMDHRILLPDGSERIVHERAHVTYDDVGVAQRMIGAVQDVTLRKRTEQELQRLNLELERRVAERTEALTALNQELEAFSYSVSHDLRAPLRAIHGFSQALIEEYAARLDAAGVDYLQRIDNASRRMSEIIEALLGLSQVIRAPVRYGEVSLSALAADILADLARQNGAREVTTVVAPDIVVHGDARLLRILLHNLLGNAWKFTAGHARAVIELGVARLQDEQVYFVRDDGAGFDMAYASKLFTPFQRLHGATEFEGTGIGLVTVQRIVRRHGGRIWAEGAVERGATFYFTLEPQAGREAPA